MRQPSVSFVIPMFNEEENIDQAIDAYSKVLDNYPKMHWKSTLRLRFGWVGYPQPCNLTVFRPLSIG